MLLATLKAEFLKGLLQGDRKHCSSLVLDFFEKEKSIIKIYEELLKPSMYMIGDLWEINKITVATEHLASAITESILNELYPYISPSVKTNKTVVVSCLENEHHQIGSKMVADVFEKEGWNVLFLGANTPEKSLIEYIRLIDPTMLALSVSLYFHLPYLEDLLKKLEYNFPKLKTLVGGQALSHAKATELPGFKNVIYLKNLTQIEHYLN